MGLGTLVPVLGAHPQAGASDIVLALADAAAMCDLRVLLIDCADPARSGLAGIAGVEGRSLSVSADKAPVRLASRLLARGAVATRRLVGDGSPLAVSAVPQPLAWAAAGLVDLRRVGLTSVVASGSLIVRVRSSRGERPVA